MKLENITAGSVAEEDVFTVSPEEDVRGVLNRIKEEGIFAVPVVENGDLEGVITWRTLIQRSAPPRTKVKKLVEHPPKIDRQKNLSEVAELMLETGARAVPVMEDGNIVGLITQKEIIEAVLKDDRFRERELGEFPEVVTLTEDETIGKAKALMRENRIARLPVVDDGGELVGSIDMAGIVKTFNVEDALTLGDRKADKLPDRDSPVTAVINRRPSTVDASQNLQEAAEEMARADSLYSIAVEDELPVGIITPKDILEVIASMKEGDGAYIQVAGAEGLDSFEKGKILGVAERTVKKAGRMFRDVENLILHIKKQNMDGGQTQYSVRARVFTSAGLFVAKEDWEWNLLDAVENCLDSLEKRFTKFHEKRIQSSRGRGS